MGHRRTFTVDPDYVNIHGKQVTAFISEETGEIAVALKDVAKMGFSVLRKCHYNKLCIDQSKFDDEFFQYILDCAQRYMLEKSIVFEESKILESINKVKRILIGDGVVTENLISPPRNQSNRIPCGDGHVSENITSPPKNHTQNYNTHRTSLFDNDSKPIMNLREPHSRPNKNYNQNRGSLNNNPEMERTNFHSSPNSNYTNGNGHRNLKSTSDFNSESGPKNFKSASDYESSENGFRKSKFASRRPQNEQNGAPDSPSEHSIERPKLQNVEFTKSEHNVLVSFVDKNDILWVQDVENASVLLDIDKKIVEDLDGPVLRNTLTNRLSVNTVYLAKDEGAWYRCKIIKFRPVLLAFFIDYGNIAEITEVIAASEELAKIPCQAVKVKLCSQQKPEFGDRIKISIKDRESNGTYVVEIMNEKKDGVPAPLPAPKIKTYFTKPSPICKLENGQRVMVIGHHDGKLVVRTKICCDKQAEIERSLNEIENTEFLDSVELGQLVLYNKDKKFRRAIVTDVKDKAKVEIELLDYWDKIKTDLASLKNINESLAKEPITYLITPQLKGYSSIFNASIEEAIKHRTKYEVILQFNEFDLKRGDELFSMKYKPTEKPSDRPMIRDFLWYQAQPGPGKYFLYSYNNTENLTFADDVYLNDHLEQILKGEMDDSEPYEPIVGEVCWGFFDDTWCRCLIEEVNQKQYKVNFVDFGTIDDLTSKNLRKYKDDVKAVKILGLSCRLTGLPVLQNIEELVRRNLQINETYDIDIKRFREGTYEITIPSLYAKLRE